MNVFMETASGQRRAGPRRAPAWGDMAIGACVGVLGSLLVTGALGLRGSGASTAGLAAARVESAVAGGRAEGAPALVLAGDSARRFERFAAAMALSPEERAAALAALVAAGESRNAALAYFEGLEDGSAGAPGGQVPGTLGDLHPQHARELTDLVEAAAAANLARALGQERAQQAQTHLGPLAGFVATLPAAPLR